ncbi:DNA-dependent metalloprotease SPRTN isoform X2 [Andrena cerasifolii]|uniref:DNA-dependent metalloprotease SPRTN isoform X2 n=1 Tax=Andrena cerasifolii TaxID=2819439 RepID=UPI0040377B09
MFKSQKSRDFELAHELHQQDNCFGLTENAIIPKNNKENYKPRTLIDQTLELIDPTPNIYTLFVQFNERFFWNTLLPVEVKWSSRMTSCAGTCTFRPGSRQCIITLSAPLLKLRPRKDLVETLLHEMIHGFLFLTNNNRDRDGHGPEFCKHMNRINEAAGTKISIYHSFHDEVKLYQQHWWRCNGPCQGRAPYFGTVRRAMNRAPGLSDFWWKEHQRSCGGQFIKIKEPENFKGRASKSKEKAQPALKSINSGKSMSTWLAKPTTPITNPVPKFTSTPTNIKPPSNTQNSFTPFKKLGNSTNNVHGWGTSGPNGSNSSPKATTSIFNSPKFSSPKTLGGSATGQSNLLSKYNGSNKHHESNANTKKPGRTMDTFLSPKAKKPVADNTRSSNKVEVKLVECPICYNFVLNDDINKHVDSCLVITQKETVLNINSPMPRAKTDNSSSLQKRKSDAGTTSNKQLKLDNFENVRKTNCPVCNKSLEFIHLNEHLDKCLLEADDANSIDKTKSESIISISSTSSGNSSSSSFTEVHLVPETCKNVVEERLHKCLICNVAIVSGMTLAVHLEDCIGSVFNDSSSIIECNDGQMSEVDLEIPSDQNDKFPCPVCMQLVSESLMNQHLDVCLKS